MEAGKEESASKEELTFPAFPYPPYGIQVGFMRELYRALEHGGVGLFESPTGTGKTLSLICSSLQWLKDSRRKQQQALITGSQKANQKGPAGRDAAAGASDSDDEPDWMREYTARKEQEARREVEEQRAKRLRVVREGLAAKWAEGAKAQARQRQSNDTSDPDAEFLVEDWQDSEGEAGSAAGSTAKRRRLSGSRAARVSVLDSSDEGDSEGGSEGEGMLGEQDGMQPKKTQVIFSSRTHSQLSQFVGELRRTPFTDTLSLVALASRKALCINDAVLALGSPSLINERCLEMQRATPSGGKRQAGKDRTARRCPFLACGTQAASTTHDIILAQPMDIEELAALGRRKSVCPYYAARRALPEADVVLAPYSSLLVADTREALGLTLTGNAVIVDEGHNLGPFSVPLKGVSFCSVVEAINSSHSAELSASQAAAAHRQLKAYFERFRTQLSPGNARHLQTLINVTQTLGRQMDPTSTAHTAAAVRQPGGSSTTVVQTVNDFLLASGLDNINMFRLVQYVKESKAVYKVAGYAQAQAQRAKTCTAGAPPGVSGTAQQQQDGGSTGALHALVGFMQALTNDDSDGRVILERRGGKLRFVLLNAAVHFAKVASAAHAVVLASGTLSPIDPLLQLFPFTPREKIYHYACGHVVGKDRLLTLTVGSGPSGVKLDFRHESRAAPTTMDELGRLVTNLTKVVPGGMVLFFPSFSYAEQVYASWQSTGVLRQLSERKRVFREPRAAGEVEALLQDYAACIQATRNTRITGSSSGDIKGSAGKAVAPQQLACDSGSSGVSGLTGGVLLCVVGGKLSEGINFGDALGRCVVMVGLPYPNPSDPELQERLRYIDRQQQAQLATQQLPGQQAVVLPGSISAVANPACTLPSSQLLQSCNNQQPAPIATSVAVNCSQHTATSSCTVPSLRDGTAGCGGAVATGTAASRQYYEDLCMKAVNQCVGRVVRHARDYAAVLLVDVRYAAAATSAAQQTQHGIGGQQSGSDSVFAGPLAKLPGWVRESLVIPKRGGGFGEAYGQLAMFFKRTEAEVR